MLLCANIGTNIIILLQYYYVNLIVSSPRSMVFGYVQVRYNIHFYLAYEY